MGDAQALAISYVPKAWGGVEAQDLLLWVPWHGTSLPLVTPASLLDSKESRSGAHGPQWHVVQVLLEMLHWIPVQLL